MRHLLLVAAIASSIAATALSQQPVVNVDVGNATNPYSGQGALADPGNNFWNAINGAGSNLLAANGTTPTGISVSVSATGTFTWGNSNALLADYVYASQFSVPVGAISITGLQPNSSYVIYVYSAGDKIDQAGVITLNGVVGCTSGSVSTQFVDGENYTVLEVQSNSVGVISGIFEPLHRDAAINGLQIKQGALPARVLQIKGSESPTVRLPGASFRVTVDFGEPVTLSQAGGAALDVNLGGATVAAVHVGATSGRALTFEAVAPTTIATNVIGAFVVANSLRRVSGATLVDAGQSPVVLTHGQIPLPNDQVSVDRLAVYPPVSGLQQSAHYRFRVREIGGIWQAPFAFFTKCPDAPATEWGYYSQHIGGWSHTYCNFEMADGVPIEVEITRLDPVTLAAIDIASAVPHPRRKVRSWRVENGKAYVVLDRPALFAVDIDGQHDDYVTPTPRLNENALHGVSVFANPFLLDKPQPDGQGVLAIEPGDPVPDDGPWTTLYFKRGVHQLHSGTYAFGSDFRLRGGRSYYIPGDAVVHGNCNNENDAGNSQNIRIFGHGTLSGERIDHPFELGVLAFEDQLRSSPIRISNGARGCRVEGVTIADPAFHACTLDGGFNGRSQDINHVRWAKVLGWRANSDGITPNGSGYVEDCFLRTQDDGSYISGLGIRRMVYWHDVNGMPLRCSQLLKHNDAAFKEGPMLVEDIDVIYARTFFGSGAERSVIGYPSPDTRFPGTTGAHIVFRDVQVEDLHPTRLLFGWGLDGPLDVQDVSGVRFENVRAVARNLDGETDILVGGPAARIAGLTFDDVVLAGAHFDDAGDFVTNAFVTGLGFANTAAATRTFRNTSGYGKWHINDDWDDGVEPADNDIVRHVAQAGTLEIDAPAYAGTLQIGHAGTATIAVRSRGLLTVTSSLSVGGASGSGALRVLDGTVHLRNSAATALAINNGSVHLDRGVITWRGNHVADIQSLHGAGAITFARGRESASGVSQATLVAQDGPSRLYASYDVVGNLTTVFVLAPVVYGSGCGAPALAFTPNPAARPILGRTATATITNAPTNFGGVIAGFSNQSFAGAPLPFALDAIGMTGCLLWNSAELIGLPVTPISAGSMLYSLVLPSTPSLLGATVYLQGFAAAPGANPLSLLVSNGIAWTVTDA